MVKLSKAAIIVKVIFRIWRQHREPCQLSDRNLMTLYFINNVFSNAYCSTIWKVICGVMQCTWMYFILTVFMVDNTRLTVYSLKNTNYYVL